MENKMNILKDYLKPGELKNDEKLIEAKVVYECDEEKRYKRILSRLRLINPKLHDKIINLD
jgi:hypothetical protein